MSREPTPGEYIIDSRDVISYIEEKESEIECFNDDIDTAEQDIANLEEEINVLREEISELNSDDDEDEIANLEDEIAAKHTAISDLLGEIESYRSDIESAEDDLKPYKELAEQAEGYGDWNYGEALILDEYFVEYAQQLAEDIGAIDRNLSWPNNCIDWEQAAEELKNDYMSVKFGGYDYLMRF